MALGGDHTGWFGLATHTSPAPLPRSHRFPQLSEESLESWGKLYRRNSRNKGQFLPLQHCAENRGTVFLNYYSLLPTEGLEKQQQTRLLLRSSKFANRQQYVNPRLRNLLRNLLLAKRTRPLPVPHSPRPPHPADRPSAMVVLSHSGNTVLPASQWHRDSRTHGLHPLSCAEG
jgi:hypothetical protein